MSENFLLSTLLDTDSYKLSHWKQYPPKTTYMHSYMESRGGNTQKVLFFGLQYYLKKYLSQRVTAEQVKEAAEFAKLHGLPFNEEGWMHVVNVHQGKLPVRIKAVREGTRVDVGNVMLAVESTDEKCFWVVSWLETMLLRVWYPCTVATNSRAIKELIFKFLEKTSDDPSAEINFKLHDFGSRGVSSQESAMIGGAAHLVNFMGSDTIAGVYMANKYYSHDMSGFSIPASEHSTITMWGKENEVKAFENMLEQYKESPLVACVSDSYNIYDAVEHAWGHDLKSKVDELPGALVIRPDSGDPVHVIENIFTILERKFSFKVNSKGYKVFDKVRVIQGDGVNYHAISNILEMMDRHKWSATNIAFGMGGALLQNVNRDTYKFAFKCSSATVDGKEVDVFKDPIDDFGKRSKAGRLALIKDNDSFATVRKELLGDLEDHLEVVFENGTLLREQNFEDVRKLSNI